MSLSICKSLSIVSLLKLFITAEDTPFRFRLPLERHHSIQISLKFKPLELNRPFILRHILKGTRTHARSNRFSGKPRCYNPWDWPERRAYSILGTTVQIQNAFSRDKLQKRLFDALSRRNEATKFYCVFD